MGRVYDGRRMNEIIDNVIYKNIEFISTIILSVKDSEDAFYMGEMVGRIERQLEIELEMEVEEEEEEEDDEDADFGYWD